MPDRRTTLLDAALELVGTQGMRGLTHRAVDAAADLPPGSTSNYFRTRAALLNIGVACLVAAPARADEGQWMPEQIANLDHEALRRAGLELTAEQLWDGKGGGLLRAAVNLSARSAMPIERMQW